MPAWLLLAIAATFTTAEPIEQVTAWAEAIGKELASVGRAAVRREEAQAGFKSARVIPVHRQELLNTIAAEIEKMMAMKVWAVKRLVEKAEEAWFYSPYVVAKGPLYHFRDAKRLNVIDFFKDETVELKENGHFFGNAVNISFSVVHVPTHVYDGSPKMLRGIEWSRDLEEVFIENYKRDPSLYWQYFGSAKGFMRRYPASSWNRNAFDERGKVPDLFDCRTRAWYIEAASSPKDVLILVDNSGSMKGEKKVLAKRIAFEILDTLGSNDFVNILSFNITVREVVCCFKDTLVQANLANIRDLKIGMEVLEKPYNNTDFPLALDEAFRILKETREARRSSNCNQAIMLITDGSPETYEELFRMWNWDPGMPVRMFTYLLGEEAELREVKWMACHNRGYFAHISVPSEIRELVIRYISVMARPLVLNNTFHPVVWAPVYADIVDPKITDYLWEKKEREIQKGLTWFLRNSPVYKKWRAGGFKGKMKTDKTLKEIADMSIKDENLKDDREYLIDTTIKRYPYKMMTSVSMPVYDTRPNMTKEAEILGVVGTDVPNFEIQRLMVPYMLGVNGYAFLVTNNGYIIIHPELRPDFKVSIGGETTSILKPNYNNVDVMDLEQPYDSESDGNETPTFNSSAFINKEERCVKEDRLLRKQVHPCLRDDPGLLGLREDLIRGVNNGSATLAMKGSYDGLRRVYLTKRHYYYASVNETPFELVLVLPEGYGSYRVESRPELISRQNPNFRRFDGKNQMDYFKDKNWKIHPNWYYCKYHYTDNFHFESPEEEFRHFLNRTMQSGWRWPKQVKGAPDHYHCHLCNSFRDNSEKANFYCDKNLFLSLLFDAKATDWFTRKIRDIKHNIGLVLVFISTRSGLTRWQDVIPEYSCLEDDGGDHFSELHKSSIDETWYKRAVELNYAEPDSFVYSVPYNAGSDDRTLVTASQAIFLSNGTSKAPVAVVGFQFKHSGLYSLFTNVTYCSDEHKSVKSCESAAYDCYILDNHGYILVSEDTRDTGKFFGAVQGQVMERMIVDRVYRKIGVHDFQAVCFIHVPGKKKEDNYANRLYINRTRPQPCETKVNLFLLNNKKVKNGISAISCTRPYYAKDIPFSNLILVVVNSSCTINKTHTVLIQHEEVTHSDYWCCRRDRNLTRSNIAPCISSNDMEQYMLNVCGGGAYVTECLILLVASVFLVIVQ